MAKTSALASQPGGKSTAKQPNDYIQTVRHHAARDIRTSLYPGVNYGHLTRFLQQHSSHHSSHSPSSRLNYAVIHDLSHSHGEHGRVIAFDADSGRDDFANHPYPEVGSGHLVFLHGYPSPEWMGVVGARYRVDPEFFHRLLIHTQSGDFYDTPALPSASTNIITLPFCSLGQYLGGFIRATEGDETLDTHFRNLGVRFRTGESIVRAFHLHDEQHFSLVQNISLCVIPRKSSGWSAIVYLDVGRPLDTGPPGPWSRLMTSNHGDVFCPVIQSRPNLSLMKHPPWATVTETEFSDSVQNSRFLQSASLLSHQSYGRFLSETLMKADPFYALTDIFAFVASSENQLFNSLNSKLDTGMRYSVPGTMISSLTTLTYHRQIFEEHIEQIEKIIAIIERRGNMKWPTIVKRPADPMGTTTAAHTQQDSSATSEINSTANRILDDYQYLLRRAQSISRRYQDAIDHLRNNAMLGESKKAMEQARGVARLSLLAFFFLPLGFTTSFFGMNFAETNTGLSIWVFFAVSVPAFFVTAIVCYWKESWELVRRYWKRGNSSQ